VTTPLAAKFVEPTEKPLKAVFKRATVFFWAVCHRRKRLDTPRSYGYAARLRKFANARIHLLVSGADGHLNALVKGDDSIAYRLWAATGAFSPSA
jgi:hypothetical protein